MRKNQIKSQLKQLKGQLKAANSASNVRLIKLTLVMLVLAITAAWLYGRIHL